VELQRARLSVLKKKPPVLVFLGPTQHLNSWKYIYIFRLYYIISYYIYISYHIILYYIIFYYTNNEAQIWYRFKHSEEHIIIYNYITSYLRIGSADAGMLSP
jgi:hypothetical protein